ncbi:MAG: serine/threonine protein kinase, partial [Sorangiineae bacterium PRO1]|nr:serine/threonine protein kinase [Sorangiineae bacterium PRO1]
MSAPPETSPADSIVGSVLAERYRLDELLGEGAMGRVYAAEHVLMRKRVAVKVLRPELCDTKDVVARFEREAMATANIEHPNIAAATDCGKLPDGSLFLVLELVQGRSLRDEIAAGAMPVPRALHIARQTASALAAAHALGIVHRDLKPENVMLVTQGEDSDFVKMLDFGLAKLTDGAAGGAAPGARAPAPLTRVGVVHGTPEYMPPEQALGLSVDHRADLYALGVITYELLSGVRPFSAESDAGLLGQQLSKVAPPFSERVPGLEIPERVEQVVRRLLAKEVSARFQTAQEVEQAFDELLRPAAVAEPDGAPTAILGTAAELYGSVAAPAAPLPEPAPPAQGPGGTLLLD